jgi:Mg2+ and Co2+ transporter CorA
MVSEKPVSRPGLEALGGLTETLPGLVFGYGFDAEGHATVLSVKTVAEAMTARSGWVWLHFNLADKRARDWIDLNASLPDTAKELFLEADDHLRLSAEDDALFGVFADFRRELTRGTQDIAHLKFALAGRLLITGRRQSLQSIEDLRRALARGERLWAGEALLEWIFDNFADQVTAMNRELAERLEVIEERVLDDRVDPEDMRVGPIRRVALRLNRQVGALRIHFAALVDNPERDLPEDVFAMAERVALRLTSIGRDVEAIQERARIIQEEASAKSAEHMNRQLSALSALTALFLPATLVTGLFGMNTHGLPFDDHDHGFWLAGFVAAAGSGLVYLILRRMGLMK